MNSQLASEPARVPVELQPGEQVMLVAHRHWVHLALKLTRDIVLGVLPVLVVILVINWTTGFDGALGGTFIGLIVLWLLFWAARAYFTWYKYQNDIWVVTNQRIVDSLKRNWFHHKMASADLVNVEDMSIEQRGLFATAFKYGDLVCQTAGARANFVLAGIPNPAQVLGLVDRLRDAARRHLIRGDVD